MIDCGPFSFLMYGFSAVSFLLSPALSVPHISSYAVFSVSFLCIFSFL